MNLNNITFGSLQAFNVVVEIERGSNLKYEYNAASKEMKLDFVFENLTFPFNYGFIIGILGGDNDALDAIVLSSSTITSGTAVQCQAIGILKTIDRGEVDDKIVCLPTNDPKAKSTFDIGDLPPNTLQKWTEFYLEVARQKKKVIEILRLGNKQEALEEIKNALE